MKKLEQYKIKVAYNILDEILESSKTIEDADINMIKEVYKDINHYKNSINIYDRYMDPQLELYKDYFVNDKKFTWLCEPDCNSDDYFFYNTKSSELPSRTNRFSEVISYIEKQGKNFGNTDLDLEHFFPKDVIKDFQLDDCLFSDQQDTMNSNNLMVFPSSVNAQENSDIDGLNVYQPVHNDQYIRLCEINLNNLENDQSIRCKEGSVELDNKNGKIYSAYRGATPEGYQLAFLRNYKNLSLLHISDIHNELKKDVSKRKKIELTNYDFQSKIFDMTKPVYGKKIGVQTSDEKGSTVNFFDYKSNRWSSHFIKDTLLTRLTPFDNCGENMILYNCRKSYMYDTRSKNLSLFEDFGQKEKYFYNLIYNAFRVGDYLAFVTSYKFHLYDIRFPKDCVLNDYHMCEISPERNANTRDYFEDCIFNINNDDLNNINCWTDIEKFLLGDKSEECDVEKEFFSNSCCLYSTRKGGKAILNPNYNPKRRRNTVNHLNLGQAREVNQTIDANAMLSGLTISNKQSNILFSSSIIDTTSKTRGFSLYKYYNNLVSLQSDNKDGLSLQVMNEKPESEKLDFYLFENIKSKNDDEIFFEIFNEEKSLFKKGKKMNVNTEEKSVIDDQMENDDLEKSKFKRKKSEYGFRNDIQDKIKNRQENLEDSDQISQEISANLSDLTGEQIDQEAKTSLYIENHNLRPLAKLLLKKKTFVKKFSKHYGTSDTEKAQISMFVNDNENISGNRWDAENISENHSTHKKIDEYLNNSKKNYKSNEKRYTESKMMKIDKSTKDEFKTLSNKEMVVTKRCINQLMTQWELDD